MTKPRTAYQLSTIMRMAWLCARADVCRLGGSLREHFATQLRVQWRVAKENARKAASYAASLAAFLAGESAAADHRRTEMWAGRLNSYSSNYMRPVNFASLRRA